MITVVVVDDQQLVRDGLAGLLAGSVNVVGVAADGADGLRLCQQRNPDVALVDVVMPVMDGPAATAAIVEACPTTRVLAITTYREETVVVAMLQAGASGFLLKDTPPEQLVAAIEAVHAGNLTIDPGLALSLTRQVPHSSSAAEALTRLTEREVETLRLVGLGHNNDEIADKLAISKSTVKTHVGQLLRKLERRDRVALVIHAYESGLVSQ